MSIFENLNIFEYLLKSLFYYLSILISIFNEKKRSRVKFYLEKAWVSPFKKFLQSVMSTNFRIFEYNDPWILFVFVFMLFPEYEYIRIFVWKICGIQIYLEICLVHNVAFKYIWIFVCVHFMIYAHHWPYDPSLLHRSIYKIDEENHDLVNYSPTNNAVLRTSLSIWYYVWKDLKKSLNLWACKKG